MKEEAERIRKENQVNKVRSIVLTLKENVVQKEKFKQGIDNRAMKVQGLDLTAKWVRLLLDLSV